jgi:parallel beta-helix repeat protein
MSKKPVCLIVLFTVLVGVLGVSFNVHKVDAPYQIIYIKADGSIEPSTPNIESLDNVTYTFKANMNASIVVQRSNITIDGKGYTLGIDYLGATVGFNLTSVNNVTIKNMEIRGFEYGISLYVSSNNTISGNNITNNEKGINLNSSSNNNTLTGNNVAGNSAWGIGVGGSINNVISGNNITGNPGYGVLLSGSLGNTISGNNIANNNYGILLYVSSNNTVSGNKITANYNWGISLSNSSNNGISENNITNNDIGIELDEFPNNRIYHNNFIDNTQQVHIEPSGYANFWDNGVEGNYWNNYTGVDVDGGGDGVGDGPHIIDLNNTDNHPLMGPVSFFEAGTWNEKTYYVHTVSNSTVSDFHFSQSNKVVSFNVTGLNDTPGFCRVAISRELLWCEDIFDWTVRVNGTIVPIRIQEYADHTYLHFTYSHSLQNVKIFGTKVIPEFPSFLVLPLFMTATLLAVIAYRKKHST